MSITREDLAWAAGLFEGEGTFSGNVARVGMTDPDVINRFEQIFPFLQINRHLEDRSKKSWKTMYYATIARQEHVQSFIAMIWPWLGIRRKAEAKEALNWINRDRRNGTSRKLDWIQVREIRSRGNEPLSSLSEEFGVDKSAISQILTGVTWRDQQYTPKQPDMMPSAILDWDQVREIRRRYIGGDRWHPGNANELAEEFGVGKACIRQIISGRRWKEEEREC